MWSITWVGRGRLEGERDENINRKTEKMSDLYKTSHCASCHLDRLYTGIDNNLENDSL